MEQLLLVQPGMSCMVYPEGRGKTVKDRLPVPEGCRSPIRVVYYRFYHTYFYLAVETDKKDLLQQAFLDGGFRLPCGFSGCFRSAFPWQARKRLRGQRGQRRPDDPRYGSHPVFFARKRVYRGELQVRTFRVLRRDPALR